MAKTPSVLLILSLKKKISGKDGFVVKKRYQKMEC